MVSVLVPVAKGGAGVSALDAGVTTGALAATRSSRFGSNLGEVVIIAPPANPMLTAANTVPTPAKKEVVLKAISRPPPFEGNATGESAFPAIGILSRALIPCAVERFGDRADCEPSAIEDDQAMKAPSLACAVALSLGLVPVAAAAATNEWKRYVIAKNGAAIEIPVSLFSEDAGPSEGGLGRRFYTNDHRADLTVEAIPNLENDTPAAFLAKKRPPSDIVYRRVTPEFFVVSSFRNGRIWYNRCNQSDRYMNCVLINYPASEKQQWDGVVTRISHTLTP